MSDTIQTVGSVLLVLLPLNFLFLVLIDRKWAKKWDSGSIHLREMYMLSTEQAFKAQAYQEAIEILKEKNKKLEEELKEYRK